MAAVHKNGLFLIKFDSIAHILNNIHCVMSNGCKMYVLMLLSLVFYSIGVVLFALDLVKKKPVAREIWPEDNIWKDADEWAAFRRNRRASKVNLSF